MTDLRFHAVAWALLRLSMAQGNYVPPQTSTASTCSDATLTVAATLEGYAAASASVEAALPDYWEPFSCGYQTCFNTAMSHWSSWEYGPVAASSTATSSTASATTSPSSSTQASATSALHPLITASPSHVSYSRSNATSPNIVGRDISRGVFPSFNKVVSSCCGPCQVWVGNAEILWWPGATSAAPSGVISTTVYNDVTL